MADAVTVLIGGDVCPTAVDLHAFVEGRADVLFGDLLVDLLDADIAIMNLECPLADTATPIPKRGPVFRAPTTAIGALRNATIDILNLANNHILDQGGPGLSSTVATIEAAGIKTVGAGENLCEAQRPLALTAKGVPLKVLAVTEHEFSIAGRDSPGANPLDVMVLTEQLQTARAHGEYVVVLLHGGNEHYPYPSPRLRRTCRYLVEQGARAVICQHSHCVGYAEQHGGGHIVYGQGNFVFQKANSSEDWNRGVLVRLQIDARQGAALDLIPFQQSRDAAGVNRMVPDEALRFLSTLGERSREAQQDEFIEQRWRAFCEGRRHEYLSRLRGHGRFLTRLNRSGLVSRLLYRRETILTLQNLIRCEAHREVVLTLLDRTHDRKIGRSMSAASGEEV